ncbi:MAG: periplasmic heavy metal sensor [Pseudomonadales bacterium]|nr:periplasmic heavy metal sensor [Pseudomonadales bacterium]
MSRHKLLIIGLVVSLGINLFLVGGIAMRLNNMRDFANSRPFPPNVGWIIRDLEDSRQQELLETLEPLGEEISPYRRAMFEAQRRVNRLMSASEYDATELEAAFAELREAAQNYTTLTHEQTLQVLNQLSEEERRTAMEFIQRRGPRDGRDGFRGGPGGPGFRPPFGPDGPRGPDGDRRPPGFPPPNGGPVPPEPN